MRMARMNIVRTQPRQVEPSLWSRKAGSYGPMNIDKVYAESVVQYLITCAVRLLFIFPSPHIVYNMDKVCLFSCMR